MKKRPAPEPDHMGDEDGGGEVDREAGAGHDDDDLHNGTLSSSSDDVCKALLDRYGKSSAQQHRHLCASACAMRSILSDEGLPLTPPAYFAAVLTAIRDADAEDREAVQALSSFLSILLPLVPVGSVPPPKAKDASLAVIELLRSGVQGLGTPTVRSLIKALGFLVLCLGLDDWGSVELPLETLLRFSLDRRPKVRRCAQICVEKIVATLKVTVFRKNISKLILSMFKKCAPLNVSGSQNKNLPKSEHMDILHMLYILKLVIPNLSKKTIMKLLPDIYKLLGCKVSIFTRHVLTLLEVLLEYLEVDALISESEKVISVLLSYASPEQKNPIDTVLSASFLLKNILNRLHSVKPSIWIENLPLLFNILAGLLDSKTDTADNVMGILRELISCHIDHNIFPINVKISSKMRNCPESKAMESLCSLLEKKLSACASGPNEQLLTVISDLFLKLGELSFFFMKNIIIQLSQRALDVKDTSQNHLHACLGSAIIAIGPEKILSLLPISLDVETMTCSNTWLIPILRKYVIGASLQFFMEGIVPLANNLKDKCRKGSRKVKRSPAFKDLQLCANNLWGLLPAFCHYSMDTSQNFGSLAQLLVVSLKEDTSLHKPIAVALEVLVNDNKHVLEAEQNVGSLGHFESAVGVDFGIRYSSLPSRYSKEVATENIRVVASCSVDLFQTLVDVCFDSPPQNLTYLKGAIECLASVVGSSNVEKSFLLLSNKLAFNDAIIEHEDFIDHTHPNGGEGRKLGSRDKDEQLRNVAMELASCFVQGGSKDLVNIIFDCIKPYISAKGGTCNYKSYFVLRNILKEHLWFCSERLDELLELLIGTKANPDANTSGSRLSCLQFLIVYLLKTEEENAKSKTFLILNEIILALKDSDKDVRKSAYDLLLAISISLKDSQSDDLGSPLHKLLNMIMGYFSGSSPQIMSGAVAALSLLMYKDAGLCLSAPNLLPSILSLLQKKDNEIIKAALGFVKVLVSSLNANELNKLLADIVNGTLPWSSVSRNHFRSKVKIIFEIMMRKCGATSVNTIVPEKYRGFVRSIEDQRKTRPSSEEAGSAATIQTPLDSPVNRKRKYDHASVAAKDKSMRPSKRSQNPKQQMFTMSGASERKKNENEGSGGKHVTRHNHSTLSGKSLPTPRFNDKINGVHEKLRRGLKRSKSVWKDKNKESNNIIKVAGSVPSILKRHPKRGRKQSKEKR